MFEVACKTGPHEDVYDRIRGRLRSERSPAGRDRPTHAVVGATTDNAVATADGLNEQTPDNTERAVSSEDPGARRGGAAGPLLAGGAPPTRCRCGRCRPPALHDWRVQLFSKLRSETGGGRRRSRKARQKAREPRSALPPSHRWIDLLDERTGEIVTDSFAVVDARQLLDDDSIVEGGASAVERGEPRFRVMVRRVPREVGDMAKGWGDEQRRWWIQEDSDRFDFDTMLLAIEVGSPLFFKNCGEELRGNRELFFAALDVIGTKTAAKTWRPGEWHALCASREPTECMRVLCRMFLHRRVFVISCMWPAQRHVSPNYDSCPAMMLVLHSPLSAQGWLWKAASARLHDDAEAFARVIQRLSRYNPNYDRGGSRWIESVLRVLSPRLRKDSELLAAVELRREDAPRLRFANAITLRQRAVGAITFRQRARDLFLFPSGATRYVGFCARCWRDVGFCAVD